MTHGRPARPVHGGHDRAPPRLAAARAGQPLVITRPAAELGRAECRRLISQNRAHLPAHGEELLGLKLPRCPAGLAPRGAAQELQDNIEQPARWRAHSGRLAA